MIGDREKVSMALVTHHYTTLHYTMMSNHLSCSFFSRCFRFTLDRFPRIHHFMTIIGDSQLKSSLTLILIDTMMMK